MSRQTSLTDVNRQRAFILPLNSRAGYRKGRLLERARSPQTLRLKV